MTRVGSDYNLLLARRYLTQLNETYTKQLEPLSTGKRINHLSDDPSRLSTYMQSLNDLTQLDQYGLNVANAKLRVGITDSTLGEMNDLMTEVYTLALQGNDQTSSDADLSNLVSRLSSIKEDLVNLANTQIGSTYVFSGYLTSTKPFSGTPIAYNGDNNFQMVKVSDNKEVQTNIDADQTFMGGGTGIDIFDTIDDLITSIQARDETAVGTLITDITTAQDQLSDARATMGNSLKSLETAETRLATAREQVSERISSLADVDMATATTDLSFTEYALQSSMEVTKRVLAIGLQSFFE
jgi:flagellar hook-associated protein 3 FlgL